MDEMKKAKEDAVEIIKIMKRLPERDQVYLLGLAKGLEAARKYAVEQSSKKTA